MQPYIFLLTLCAGFLSSMPVAASTPFSTSWLETANHPECDFPLQNLPYGVFSPPGAQQARIGVAIGDHVLDIPGAIEQELISVNTQLEKALNSVSLNEFMNLGPEAWTALRQELQKLFSAEESVLRDSKALQERLLFAQDIVTMYLPVEVGDYTDFYTSVNHAKNVGSLFRPDSPLLPNFKQLPLGYNGRASSLQVSGSPVTRPWGQIIDASGMPEHASCRRLDYEMELGTYVGKGNAQGKTINMEDVSLHLFGMTLLNDWSARDIQKWEMAPLGPFNGKNFATSLGAWVVTLDALKPYRMKGPPRQKGDPDTLDYLKPTDNYALDITVEVYLRSLVMVESGAEPLLISRGNFQDMYWTIAQMLVQHASAGCNLRTGDLFGSGTISGVEPHTRGCLLEHALPDAGPIHLPDGTTRRFLEDGDEVILKAYAWREGLPRIGFGECRGQVLPAQR